MRLYFLTLFSLVLCTALSGAESAQEKYIDAYKDIAIREMQRTGVPASIKLGQALLESAAGQSYLAVKGNNHFGIKCGGRWNGAKVYREDDDYDKHGKLIKSCFRKYKDVQESFMAHSDFLKKGQRYQGLFALRPKDYKAWAKGLKKAGYATSKTYAPDLIRLIERHQLYKYDDMSPIKPKVLREEEVVVSKPPSKPRPNPSVTPPPKVITKTRVMPVVAQVNDVKMTYATGDESILDIAQRTSTAVSAILKYNEQLRSASKTLEIGEPVFLQLKRKSYRGKKRWHKVKKGESMYDIAQKYGIRLSKLAERNLVDIAAMPRVGERIILRKKRKKAPRLAPQRVRTRPAPSRSTQKTATKPAPKKTMEEPKSTPKPTPPPVSKTEEKPIKPLPPAKMASLETKEETTPVLQEPIVSLPPKPAPTLEEPKPNLEINKDNANTSEDFYTVQKKDTLYGIARMHGIALAQLREWNDLSDNLIRSGQRLRIK